MALTVLNPLPYHATFRSACNHKKFAKIFIETLLNLWMKLGGTGFLTILTIQFMTMIYLSIYLDIWFLFIIVLNIQFLVCFDMFVFTSKCFIIFMLL